jgi:hypothetical protein
MKANELRIGNFVNGEVEQEDGSTKLYTVKILAVDSTSSLGEGWDFLLESMTKTEEEIEVYEDLQPIPLTEEWLLRFGFENYGVFRLKLSDDTYLRGHINSKGFNIALDEYDLIGDRETVSLRVIKYVHQLQNLVFSLTGEELKLKDDENN